MTIGRDGLREGDLLTVPQALRLLPVGRSTIYQLVDEGQLPAIRVQTDGNRRGRILIERAALEAYVAQLRGNGQEPARVDVDAVLRRVRGRHAQQGPSGKT